jgi:hypothetical protein
MSSTCLTGATITDMSMCAVLNIASKETLPEDVKPTPVHVDDSELPLNLQQAISECDNTDSCKFIGFDFFQNTAELSSGVDYVIDTYNTSSENAAVLVKNGETAEIPIIISGEPPGYTSFNTEILSGTPILVPTNINNIADCASQCDTNLQCEGFNFSARSADVSAACELYNTTNTTGASDDAKIGFFKDHFSTTTNISNPADIISSDARRYCKNYMACNNDIDIYFNNPNIPQFSTVNIPSCSQCPQRSFNRTNYTVTNEKGDTYSLFRNINWNSLRGLMVDANTFARMDANRHLKYQPNYSLLYGSVIADIIISTSTDNQENCAKKCNAISDCIGFNFSSWFINRPTVCELYKKPSIVDETFQDVQDREECSRRCDASATCVSFDFTDYYPRANITSCVLHMISNTINTRPLNPIDSQTGFINNVELTLGFIKQVLPNVDTSGSSCKDYLACNKDIERMINNALNVQQFSTKDLDSCVYCPKRSFNRTNYTVTNEVGQSISMFSTSAAIDFMQYKPPYSPNGCPIELPYLDGTDCTSWCPVLINGYTCVNSCPSNNPYKNGNVCVSVCPPATPKLSGTTCVNYCPSSTPYISNGVCVDSCPSSTPYIVNGTTTCLRSCPLSNPYILNGTTTCVSSCPAYRDGYTCVDTCPDGRIADINAKTCRSTCLSDTPYLNGNRCVASCPVYADADICVASCPIERPYITDSKMCSSGCPVVADGYTCVTTCPSARPVIIDGVCVQECPTGQIAEELRTPGLYECRPGTSCSSLNPINNHGICMKACTNNEISHNNICVASCPSQVPLNDNGICVSSCSAARPYTNNGTCVASCPAYIKNNECVATCPVGYSGNSTTRICSVCQNGYSSPGGTAGCSICYSPKTSISGGPCTFCPVGKYPFQPLLGITQCLDCPAGYFLDEQGLTSCKKCPTGQGSTPGSNACTACQSGQTCTSCPDKKCFDSDSQTCIEPPQGYGEQLTRCTPCPANTSSIYGGQCTNCPAGQFSLPSQKCTPCPGGTSSVSGGACTNCPAGQFSTTGGACINCPANYTSQPGSAKCSPCPGGTSSLSGGVCTKCPAMWGSVSGYNCSNFCPASLFNTLLYVFPGQPYYGSASAQYYVPKQCLTTCAHAVYTAPNTFYCAIDCPPGLYTSDYKICIECPIGNYVRSTPGFSNTCVQCNAGTYSDGSAKTSCKSCPGGTFSSAGSNNCVQCPAGTAFSGSNGQSPNVCTVCPANTYSLPGSATCTTCFSLFSNGVVRPGVSSPGSSTCS